MELIKSNKKTVVTVTKTFKVKGTDNVVFQRRYDGKGKVKSSELVIENGVTPDFLKKSHLHPELVTDVFWEEIKTKNPFIDYNEFNDKESYVNLNKLTEDDEIDAKNIVFNWSSGHLCFDINFKIIPLVRYIDYIGTANTSRRTDVEGWLKELKKNKFVINNKEELQIMNAPYYNANCGRYITGKERSWNRYDDLAVLFDAKIENKALEHALNGGSGRNREFFSVAMKDFLLDGDQYAYRADQENGTKNAFPLDPLKIRKYLKPDEEEYSSHDDEDDGYSR